MNDFSDKPFHTIVTHDGVFHADDVLACVIAVIYARVHPKAAALNPRIVRTRDIDVIAGGDGVVVIDVGMGELDHHQPGGNGFRGGDTVPYAAAGLAWRKFGNDLIRWLGVPAGSTAENPAEVLRAMFDIIDKDIRMVDARDNGATAVVRSADGKTLGSALDLSTLVVAFNTQGGEKGFTMAFEFMSMWFMSRVRLAFEEARDYEIVKTLDTTLEVIVLPRFLRGLHKLPRHSAAAKLVIHPGPSNTDGDVYGEWVVATVSDNRVPRVAYPPYLRGRDGGVVDTPVGKVNLVFAHANGWTGAAASKLDAELLAQAILHG